MLYPPVEMEEKECSETSAYKIQTQGITQKKAYNNKIILYRILTIILVLKIVTFNILNTRAIQ